VRTFIAADLPIEILKKINTITAFFESQIAGESLKWVSTDNLHLTIKFIGDLPDEKLDPLKNLLTETLIDQGGFSIDIQGLRMYPNPKKPRVIWLGIVGGEPLTEIHNALESTLKPLGIPPEKRAYTPHLTIARVKRQTDPETAKLIGAVFSQFRVDSLGITTIDKVCLYKSILTPKGPVYTPLHMVSLNKV